MRTSSPYPNEPVIPQEPDPDTGLPIGPLVKNPGPSRWPESKVMEGRFCRLEPLDPETHLQGLFNASTPDDALERFQYLPDSPPGTVDEFAAWVRNAADSSDPIFYAVIDKSNGEVGGRQTLMRISPEAQCIEIGNIYWGPAISRSAVTTEANYLFAKAAFEDWGYRRYEWKCNALNEPSKRAALRFGFTYEGHFRRAAVYDGRSRDTSWFSIINTDWQKLEPAYQQWLDASNFDTEGKQKTRLSELTREALA